jgi:hypothetical protein
VHLFHQADKLFEPHLTSFLYQQLCDFSGTIARNDNDTWLRIGNDLLTACAENGNTEAVTILLQHGADILSSKILSTIVKESVKNPQRIKDFIDIYHAVVDNSVTWRCLNSNERIPEKHSEEYKQTLKYTMLYLLTGPEGNILTEAIKLGASKMMQAIINTDIVYREVITNDNPMYREIKYDVTGFTRSHFRDQTNHIARPDPFENINMPDIPYMEHMLQRRDLWKRSNIFNTEPFKHLTAPYIYVLQQIYFICSLIQLAFMVQFTRDNLPNTAVITNEFDLCTKNCTHLLSNRTLSRSLTRRGWYLIWPMAISICMTLHYLWFYLNNWPATWCCQLRNIVRCSGDGRPKKIHSLLVSLLISTVGFAAPVGFCLSTFSWYAFYAHEGTTYEQYLNVTAMMFLFGWSNVFNIFSGVTARLYMTWTVVREVVVKDVLMSFMPVFIPVFIGFSFALYVFRLTALPAMTDTTALTGTIYQILVGAFTLGNFFDDTVNETHYRRLRIFRLMFAAFIVSTTLVLFNMMVAMINSRYEKAKADAQNVWRFDTVETIQLPYGKWLSGIISFNGAASNIESFSPLSILSCCIFLGGRACNTFNKWRRRNRQDNDRGEVVLIERNERHLDTRDRFGRIIQNEKSLLFSIKLTDIR